MNIRRHKRKLLKMKMDQKWISFLEKNYLPRWVIFCIDCVIILLGYISFMFLWRMTDMPYLASSRGALMLFCFIGIYVIFARIFRTYAGVIRYSNIKDAIRLVLMVASASVTFFFVDRYFDVLKQTHFNSFIIIFFLGVYIFTLLYSFRYIVRILYFAWFVPNSKNKKRIIVLGNDISSIMLVQSMNAEAYGAFIPVVVLDIEGTREGQKLGDIPIVSLKNTSIEKVFKKYNADTLVFFKNQLKIVRERFADECLNNGIQLLMVSLFEPYSSAGKTILEQAHNISIEDLLGRDAIVLDSFILQKNIQNSTILVTGAAGSIGSEIARQVASYSCGKLILFDIAETPLYSIWLEIRESYPELDVIPILGDVRNIHDVEEVFEKFKPENVYHAAAYKHVPMMEMYPREAVIVNVVGTKNVVDMSFKYDARNFVMISTDKAVNPTNVMGASKRIAEIYVQALFYEEKEKAKARGSSYTRVITTRFGNVLGSNGSVVPIFKNQIAKGGPVTVTHKEIIRYFMTIPEACSLVLEAGCMGKGGEIFIFDMGEPVKIYDLARKMIQLAGLVPERDIQIIETGLREGEKLYEELLNDKESSTSTYNKKILIARVPRVQYGKVSKLVDELIEITHSKDDKEIVRKMKELVPEYKSRNSKYEELDKKDTLNTISN